MIYEFGPDQDLHGYANPWPVGGGKNKLRVSATTSTVSGVTFTITEDGKIFTSGTATATINFIVNSTDHLVEGESYKITGCAAGGDGSNYYLISTRGLVTGSAVPGEFGAAATATEDALYFVIFIANGVKTDGLVFTPMICLASETDASFAPYSNICPITGYDISALDYTVYKGTLDSSSGILTVNQVSVDLGTLTWYYSNAEDHERMYVSSLASIVKKPPNNNTAADILCSEYENATSNDTYLHTDNNIIGIGDNGWIFIYSTDMGTDPAAFKTKMDGVQLVYTLNTPEEVQLSQIEINELISQFGMARNFNGAEIMVNTWLYMAQGRDPSTLTRQILRPISKPVIDKPIKDKPISFPDIIKELPADDVISPDEEPEENITEEKEEEDNASE